MTDPYWNAPPPLEKRRSSSDTNPPAHLEADGVRFRVLDCRIEEKVQVYANPPAPWATFRVFRPKDGWHRHYAFTPADDRADLSSDTLAVQLQRSAYCRG